MLDKPLPRIPLDPPQFGAPIPDRFSRDGPAAFWLMVISPEASLREIELIGPKSSFAEFVPDIEKRLRPWDTEARNRLEKLLYKTKDNREKVLDPEFTKHGFTEDFPFPCPTGGTSVFRLLVCSPLEGHVCKLGECHTALFGYMPLVGLDQDLTSRGENEYWVDPRILPGFAGYTSALGHFGSVNEAKAHGEKLIAFHNGTDAFKHGWTAYSGGSRYERYGWSKTHVMKVYVCKDQQTFSK